MKFSKRNKIEIIFDYHKTHPVADALHAGWMHIGFNNLVCKVKISPEPSYNGINHGRIIRLVLRYRESGAPRLAYYTANSSWTKYPEKKFEPIVNYLIRFVENYIENPPNSRQLTLFPKPTRVRFKR